MTLPVTFPDMTFHSHSLEQTLSLGRAIGRLAPPNTCITLSGDLGAGKTQLARGIAQGANVHDPTLVSSPTYVLLNIYDGPKTVFHLDAYRITSPEDFTAVGLDDLLTQNALTLIEWPERIESLLPTDRLHIQIDHATESERTLTLTPTGPLSAALLQKIQAQPQP